MKTSKYLSFLLLASLLWACKTDEATPQPDWASKFVGTYLYIYDPKAYGDNFLQSNEYRIDSEAGVLYQTSLVAVLEKIDNTHLTMSVVLKPYTLAYIGGKRTILSPIKYTFKNARALDSSTLLIDETALDNKGNVLIKFDTIAVNPYFRDSLVYRSIAFKFSQVGEIKDKIIINGTKGFDDTSFRLFYSMTTANKFDLHKRYFFALNDGVKYEWSFGDGGTSTEEDPYHEYKSNGLYDIIYSVTDKSGKKYTIEDKMRVMNLPF
ncbi:MAG: PKD domain-containing protein [Spirosomataceae bacterium]